MLPKLIFIVSLIFVFILILFFPQKDKTKVDVTGPVVFFGNSITAGKGAGVGEDFPSLIGKNLNIPIINTGISGETTQDALKRVNNDVISKNPSVVVIEFGLNDQLLHQNTTETTRNLDLTLSKIKATGARIVILGVKITLFNQKYETDWQNLATKYNAVYVPNILEGIITDQNLKFDDIHPNAKGYQKIANRLTPIIAPLIQKPIPNK